MDGEAKRIAAGGKAISLPSAAQIETRLDAVNDLAATQSKAIRALDEAMDEVIELRPAVDRLVRDLWDEIEFAFRQEAPPALRRKARLWGVHYVSRPGRSARRCGG